MITATLNYHKVVKKICAEQKYRLHKFKPSQQEWVIAKQLGSILKVFKDATLFFSHSTPNLAKVIPAIDHIDQLLTTTEVSQGSDYDSAIQVVCGLGKKTLNKFYFLTDTSINY
ncbi:hypothetical protein L226DRAFT_567834 [Lentinus tigrinus ALCF2SS1-7]|uniref:uncharacterized protein n=1 Tax=Lentinus tigrinus ALCF2SS1-7 TaxID=1328758 RepID=UPI00116604E1|nr:hypothetical protein L226DRAFT_567834 [Lentinus tigrinus ALCF2SS1-7]